jgi:hypothetical protein
VSTACLQRHEATRRISSASLGISRKQRLDVTVLPLTFPRHFRPGSRKPLSLTRTYHVPASLNECRRVALTLATQDTTLSCSTVAGKPSVGPIRRMRGWNFEKFQGPRNATELKAIIARSRTACRHQVFIYPLSSPFSLLVYHLTHEHEENILAAKYCAVLADGEIASLQFVAN